MAAWIAAGASVIGGLLASEGQEDTNQMNMQIAAQNSAFNAQQATENRSFQERMSNTAYQRATADMQAAGLNPMLAYSQGGASSPTGSMAQAVQPAPMQNKALAGLVGAASASQISNIQADTEKKEAETDLTRSQIPEAEQRIAQSKAFEANLRKQTDLTEAQINIAIETVQKVIAETHLTRAEILHVNEEVIKAIRQQDLITAETNLSRTENVLRRLTEKAARNIDQMEHTGFGENVKPYIKPITEGIRNAVGSIPIFRRR